VAGLHHKIHSIVTSRDDGLIALPRVLGAYFRPGYRSQKAIAAN